MRASPLIGFFNGFAMKTVNIIETLGAWMLGALWLLPVVFAFWSAFHPAEFSTSFELFPR